MKKEKINLQLLSFIGISIGPGFYTSIRIGATIAKTLSFAANIPLISFCHLIGYVPKKDGPFLIISNAKAKERFYILQGVKKENTIKYRTFFCNSTDLNNHLEKKSTLISSDPEIKIDNFLHIPFSLERLAEHVFEKFTSKKFQKEQNLDLLYLT